MSGTIAAAAKARLFGTGNVLAPLSGMTGVTVAYDMPRDVPLELVVVGDVEGPQDLAAMRNNARLGRTEELSMAVEIRVRKSGQATTESGDTRAAEIYKLIAEYLAANPTLGDLVDLKKAEITSFKLSGFLDDDGATSIISFTVGLLAFLT